MTLLIVGLVLFLGIHSTAIVAPGWRDRMVEKLGEGPWKGLYSIVSFLGLGLIIYGWSQARLSPTLVWLPPVGMRHAVLLFMLPVFPLLAASYLPGRIRNAAGGHPMLLSAKFWAFSHLLANGYLHEMVTFGAFLAWAVADRISLKRRKGPMPKPAPDGMRNDLIAAGVGLALYAVTVVWAHQWLFGVAPVAM